MAASWRLQGARLQRAEASTVARRAARQMTNWSAPIAARSASTAEDVAKLRPERGATRRPETVF